MLAGTLHKLQNLLQAATRPVLSRLEQQCPELLLLLIRLSPTLPPHDGSEKPKAGSVLFAVNVRVHSSFFCGPELITFLAYTSLLRLTTSSPPVAETKEGESGTEDEGLPTVPAPVHAVHDGNGTTEVRSGGLLGGALRPGFLRGFSLTRSQPPDVENQTAQIRG